jgi:hypothetical protein
MTQIKRIYADFYLTGRESVFYKIQETRIQGTRFLSNLSLLNYFLSSV